MLSEWWSESLGDKRMMRWDADVSGSCLFQEKKKKSYIASRSLSASQKEDRITTIEALTTHNQLIPFCLLPPSIKKNEHIEHFPVCSKMPAFFRLNIWGSLFNVLALMVKFSLLVRSRCTRNDRKHWADRKSMPCRREGTSVALWHFLFSKAEERLHVWVRGQQLLMSHSGSDCESKK